MAQQQEAEKYQWHSVVPFCVAPAATPHRVWQKPAVAGSDGTSQQRAQHTQAAKLASAASELAGKAREAAREIEEIARRRQERAANTVARCVRCDVRFPGECCPPALLQQPLPAARCPTCLRVAGMDAYYPTGQQ